MDIDRIKEQIKYNCNVSDSQFWGYYSICGMLLSLRELYRREHAIKLWQSIPVDEISPWISSREELWEKLEDKDLRDIDIDGKSYHPFESGMINAVLEQQGLVYSGGYGLFHKPMFFLGKLYSKKNANGYRIYYSEEEFCHDMAFSIAMVQGEDIYVRLEPLRNILWERAQGCKGGRSKSILCQAFSQYGINGSEKSQDDLYDKIKLVSYDVAELITAHELGEFYETHKNKDWLTILANSHDRFTEFYLRGIKDILADMSEQGPFALLCHRQDKALLGIYLSLFDEVRKQLFPDMIEAGKSLFENGDWSIITEVQTKGYEMMARFRQDIITVWNKANNIEDVTRLLKSRIKS